MLLSEVSPIRKHALNLCVEKLEFWMQHIESPGQARTAGNSDDGPMKIQIVLHDFVPGLFGRNGFQAIQGRRDVGKVPFPRSCNCSGLTFYSSTQQEQVRHVTFGELRNKMTPMSSVLKKSFLNEPLQCGTQSVPPDSKGSGNLHFLQLITRT
jgi:hypothetical protein